ncbi:hypothetical protein [Labedella endophytica]|uniref:Uncharacterized protein n=1 Tax=Labedella endophytica TaxID=1523160 RepID=A0A433JP55_9MICO|nr:hypothetical protein [Labedella endophytica]RUQ98148.1 hypothetical protein ELQ94_14085 [Labedella endophytica]
MSRIRFPRRVKPGDGRALGRFRWWQLFTGRHLFYLDVDRPGGGRNHYALDVRNGEDDKVAHLYLESRQVARSRLPARIPVEGGVIEVAEGAAGLKRVHYVTATGESLLVPDPRSPVGRRMDFARTHPVASSRVGLVSVVVLLVGAVLNVLQLLEPILQIPPILEAVGRYESPVHLPIWLNVTLGLLAAAGATERALRIRYNWLLDGLGI